MSLLSLNSIGQTILELESRNENVYEQTNVGHINLIGRLVTCNPSKNYDAHLQPPNNVPTNYQLPTIYGFRDIARTKFKMPRLLQQDQRSNQGHTLTPHTYNPQPISLSSINFLHFTVFDKLYSRHPPIQTPLQGCRDKNVQYILFVILTTVQYASDKCDIHFSHCHGNTLKNTSLVTKLNSYKLIHPIQWTIANPVGADRPAKQQQKSRFVSPPTRSSTVHSPGGASYFLPV